MRLHRNSFSWARPEGHKGYCLANGGVATSAMARRPEGVRVRCGRQVPCATFSPKHSLFSPVPYLGPASSLPFPIIWGTGVPLGSVYRRRGKRGLGRPRRPGCDCWAISFYPRSLLPACSTARKQEALGSQQATHGTLRLASYGASELRDYLRNGAGAEEAIREGIFT